MFAWQQGHHSDTNTKKCFQIFLVRFLYYRRICGISFARIFSEKLTFCAIRVTLGMPLLDHFEREIIFIPFNFLEVKTCPAQVTHVSTEVYFKGRLAVPLTMRFWKGSCHMDLDMCQHKNKLVDAYIGSLYI